MKRFSWKKMSLLGIVLVGASAVAAAVIPSINNDNVVQADNGTHTPNSDGSGGANSCTIDDPTANPSCVITQGTGTTGEGAGSSNASGAGVQTSA